MIMCRQFEYFASYYSTSYDVFLWCDYYFSICYVL